MVTPEPIVTEKQEKVEQQTIKPVEVKEVTPQEVQERNFKQFREARELDRKQREEAEKKAREKEAEAQALKAAMEALLNKPQQQQSNIQQEEELTEDQRIQKKVDIALAVAEERRVKEYKENEARNLPKKLSSDFKDFDQVCNQENLDYLTYHYPEIADAYKYVPESYEKWANVYKAVKRFVPNTDSNKDAKKAENNLMKPQSMSSSGMTKTAPLQPAMRLDEDRKASNWQRMQRIMNKIE